MVEKLHMLKELEIQSVEALPPLESLLASLQSDLSSKLMLIGDITPKHQIYMNRYNKNPPTHRKFGYIVDE